MDTDTWACPTCQQSHPQSQDKCPDCEELTKQPQKKIAPSESIKNPAAKINHDLAPASLTTDSGQLGSFGLLAILAFSVLCIYGGGIAIWHHSWPTFMPPLFDMFATLFGFISPPLAAILLGVFSLALGVCGLISIFFAMTKHDEA